MLARKKEEARSTASEEARKQALWEERKRKREEEEKAAARGERPTVEKLQDPVSIAVNESRWDRLMGGGGGKKKKSKRASEPSELSQAERDRTGAGSSGKKPGEDSVSVRGARPIIRL